MALRIATFNVKDFFEATDDLSRRRLDAKVAWLAAMVTRLDADVLGLQEVGSAAVLAELTKRVEKFSYAEPVVGTADGRGIRNALISRVPILASGVFTSSLLDFPRFHASDPPPFGARLPLRRGVVHARVDAGALGQVDVLCAHFKSRHATPMTGEDGAPVLPTCERERAEGELRALLWRSAEALFVRGVADELIASRAGAKVVMLGDLNDTIDSLPVQIVQGKKGEPGRLASCAEVVPAERRFSILHNGGRNHIDHILASPALRARLRGAAFLNEELREHGHHQDENDARDSDHAPLVAWFD